MADTAEPLPPLALGGRRDRGAPSPQDVRNPELLLPARAQAYGTLRRMLTSALVLFAERGYHGVPVREIAAGAGIRASSMYEHRASKEELLLDLMLIGHEEHLANLEAALAEAGDDSVDQVAQVVRAHVLVHADFPLLTRVCNRELLALNEENLERVLAARRAAEDLLGAMVRRGVEAGVFDVQEPWLAVAAIGAMGIRVAEWFGPAAGYTRDQVAQTYAQYALRLLGHRL